MSRVCRHPPPDTLSDKDTCDSSLCLFFFGGSWGGSLVEADLLRAITAPGTEISRLLLQLRGKERSSRQEGGRNVT